MWPYFAIPTYAAFMSLVYRGKRVHYYAWGITFVFLLLFVGLRHKVGMDWNNYLFMIERAYASTTLKDAINVAEPGYVLLLWVSAELGFGVYGSNLVGTLIFCLGLFRYARTTPNPWTAILVAMPMLVTVVAMSANRQAVAIGVLLWISATWNSSSLSRRVTGILLATLFHYSAVLFLAFAVIDLKIRNSVKIVMVTLMLTLAFYILSTTGQADYYDSLYVTGQTEITKSEGAILHVLFNGGPAVLYFMVSRQKREILFPTQFHRLMAFLAIALIPASFLTSAASGRISLYLFPVSMYVVSAFPHLIQGKQQRAVIRFGISLFMLALLFLWLSFANSSQAHIPYSNFIIEPSVNWKLCC